VERTLRDLGEAGAIALMADILGTVGLPPGWLGPGDDTAITSLPSGDNVLTTCDVLVEGVHFRRETTSAEDLGWKALAVNVSDVYGMDGKPAWAVIGLALPGTVPEDWLAGLYRGLAAASSAYATPIVGGDTVGSHAGITISVTVIGQAATPRRRSDARVGDRLIATGPHGLSAAGLWALQHPEAAIPGPLRAQAERAHRRPDLPGAPHLPAGALMDDSDGLGTSCRLIAEASGVAIHLDRIPDDPAVKAIAGVAGADPRAWALWGGEDYGLVATLPPGAAVPPNFALLGTVAQGSGVWWRGRPLEGEAFRHFNG